MKNYLLLIILFTTINLSAYAQQTYKLDVKKSKILWDSRNTMGSHFGYLLFNSGRIFYSASGEPTGASITMDMKTMKSTDHTVEKENLRVDNDLKTPQYFDVAKHPFSSIIVKHINRIGTSNSYKIKGDLGIKGVSHPIDFIASIKKNGDTVSVKGVAKLDRLKYFINHKPKSWNFFTEIKDKMMADEIPITLDLVFTK